MKKALLIFSILLLFSCVYAQGQTHAITEDGKRVLLYNDGTWLKQNHQGHPRVMLDIRKERYSYEDLDGVRIVETWNPGFGKVSEKLEKHGVRITMKKELADFVLVLERGSGWTVVNTGTGEILSGGKTRLFKNCLKDAARFMITTFRSPELVALER